MSKFSFKVEGSKLLIEVDLNEDGQPVMGMFVDILEIPDEVMSAMGKAKEDNKTEPAGGQ